MGRTHMSIGLLTGLALLPFFGEWYVFLPLVVLGSLLPDVDHENSKINKMMPLTNWVPYLFKHRGFFHSLFVPVLIYLGFWYVGHVNIGIPLAIGYLSHLASDCFTRMGCNLLHPVSKLRMQGFLFTGGIAEYAVFGGVMFLNAIMVSRYFI